MPLTVGPRIGPTLRWLRLLAVFNELYNPRAMLANSSLDLVPGET